MVWIFALVVSLLAGQGGNVTAPAQRSDRLLPVRKDDRHGFIDLDGNIVIPLQFDYARPFAEGLAAVSRDRLFGFIDRTGKLAIPFRFDYAAWFQEGVAAVRVGELWGFVRPDGQYAVAPIFKQVDPKFMERLAGVKIGERWGFIDQAGTLVIPARFESVSGFYKNRALVVLDGRSASINRDGRVLAPVPSQTPPAGFDAIGAYSEGLAPVKTGDHWGFVDESGQVVIAPLFDDGTSIGSPGIGRFSEGLAAVYSQGGWQFIDRTGKVVIAGPFESVNPGGFRDGIVEFCGTQGCGYMDKNGKAIWPRK